MYASYKSGEKRFILICPNIIFISISLLILNTEHKHFRCVTHQTKLLNCPSILGSSWILTISKCLNGGGFALTSQTQQLFLMRHPLLFTLICSLRRRLTCFLEEVDFLQVVCLIITISWFEMDPSGDSQRIILQSLRWNLP